jgi:hypothetical protein
LRPDPRNAELFDDLTGPEFALLVESIQEIDQINPLTITPTGLIICGHQRYRALKAAKKKFAMVTVRAVSDDDEAQLDEIRLEEQMRRRVLTPAQSVRVVRRWYETHDIRSGRHSSSRDRARLEQLAHIPVAHQGELNAIGDLTDELMELFDRGMISRSAAFQLSQLEVYEQEKLVEKLGEEMRLATEGTIRKYRREIEALERDVARLSQEAAGEIDTEELERQHGAALEKLRRDKDNALQSLARELEIMTQRNRKLERTHVWEQNDVVHKSLKQIITLLAVDPAEWLGTMRTRADLAPFLEADARSAELLITWLTQFVSAYRGEDAEKIRRVQ